MWLCVCVRLRVRCKRMKSSTLRMLRPGPFQFCYYMVSRRRSLHVGKFLVLCCEALLRLDEPPRKRTTPATEICPEALWIKIELCQSVVFPVRWIYYVGYIHPLYCLYWFRILMLLRCFLIDLTHGFCTWAHVVFVWITGQAEAGQSGAIIVSLTICKTLTRRWTTDRKKWSDVQVCIHERSLQTICTKMLLLCEWRKDFWRNTGLQVQYQACVCVCGVSFAWRFWRYLLARQWKFMNLELFWWQAPPPLSSLG